LKKSKAYIKFAQFVTIGKTKPKFFSKFSFILFTS